MGKLKSKQGETLMNVNISSNIRLDRKMKLAMLAIAYGMTSSQVLDQLLEQATEPSRFQEFQAELDAQVQEIPMKDSHMRKVAAQAKMNRMLERYKELVNAR